MEAKPEKSETHGWAGGPESKKLVIQRNCDVDRITNLLCVYFKRIIY